MTITENNRKHKCEKVIDSVNIAVYCKGVTKSYGSGGEVVNALNGINIEVRSGELMMLVGSFGVREDNVDLHNGRDSGSGSRRLPHLWAGLQGHESGRKDAL